MLYAGLAWNLPHNPGWLGMSNPHGSASGMLELWAEFIIPHLKINLSLDRWGKFSLSEMTKA